jgi:sulfur-carrier protein
MSKVTIRYWAAAKAAADVPEESVEAATLAEALAVAVASRAPDDRLRAVLARSSFLVDATPVGRAAPESVVLADGAVVEVLPPFAGG